MFHTLGAVKNAIGVGEDEPDLRVQTEKELAKTCHRIIVATEREKEELVHLYDASPETISVIPCGVDLKLFQPVNKTVARRRLGFDNSSIILFVGRIEPLKGIDRLLLAMNNLDSGREFRLVVVGGDDHSQPEAERLRELSQQLNIQDSVTFAGAVKQEELPVYYSAADVCVIPSYYESFGLVALESLACGTPIVATEVGGIGSIVRQGETGYVLKDGTPLNLADRIGDLLSKSDVVVKSNGSIRASVARFSWSNISEAMVDEYGALLRNYPAKVC